MLFHSSIRKEMARTFGATVVVLATIVMTMMLIRTLSLATRGSVDPAEVLMVLGYTVLGHAPTILTLSLFISIVGTLSRMYRDSEMVIWFSSGRGLGSFVQPMVRFVWPVLLVIAALALFAWPWSHQQAQVLRDRFEQRGDLERVTPGQFQESAGGTRVFFVDKDSIGGKSGGQVFIAATEKGKQVVTSARTGRIDTVGSDKFLMLFTGQRLEKELGSPGLKMSEFAEYGVLVNEKAQDVERAIQPQALSTRELIAGHTRPFLGELSWRLGLALAAVNFVLIGLAVSSVNPRIGRNGNLVLSLFTFILYYNLVNLGSSRISAGTSEFWRFLLLLHGGAFVITALLLVKLHWNWTFASSLRRRRRVDHSEPGGTALKTVRRMIYKDVLVSVGFVTLGFLALFSFIDFVDELRWVDASNPAGYQVRHALMFVSTLAASTLYELIPITVLIGSVFVMARLAQGSEFTVLRTSGLGPGRAMRVMLGLGLLFTLLTFVIGDFLVPVADHAGQLLRAKYLRQISIGQTGAWLKDKQSDQSYAVNVGSMASDGNMRNVRVIDFDASGRLVSIKEAKTGIFGRGDSWILRDVSSTAFKFNGATEAQAVRDNVAEYRWPTTLTAEMVSTALLRPDRMPTIDLFQYMRHLDANGQSSQRYEIEFWRKVFYPLSCFVMMVLALPFAYLHFRTSGISTFVFIGVMTGISFFLLNDLFGHFGNLRNWSPWLTAAAPGLIYSLFSLSAFGWLVLRR